MIDRDGDDLTLVCDADGVRYDKSYESCEFHTMLSDAKGDGWRIVKEKGEWKHYSPDSSAASNEFEPLGDL